MSVKSLKTQLMAAVAMVIVAAVALSSSTYAWFAMNSQATATNMQVNAKSGGGLCIKDAVFMLSDTEEKSTISFEAAEKALYASTHNDDFAADLTTSALTPGKVSYLKYNSNPGDIDKTTGYEKTGEEIKLAEVPHGVGAQYYMDYVVYIAATGSSLDGQNLEVSLNAEEITGSDGDTSNNVYQATSVDFYVCEATTGNEPGEAAGMSYAGTLNIANSGTGKVILKTDGIPAYNDTVDANKKCLKVLMRVYIDGALKQTGSDDTAYIHTEGLSEFNGKPFTAEFNAVVPADAAQGESN